MNKLFLVLLSAFLLTNISAQDYSQVYLIGGAAPNGWANDKAEAMSLIVLNDESAVFTWTGQLKAGDFKFINSLNTWEPCFNALVPDEQVVLGQIHKLAYNLTGNDYKFTLPQAAVYTVTVDLKKLTMVIVETELGIPEELWITGSAIPNSIAKLSNAYGFANFLYVGEFLHGDFKIITTETINEFTRFIVPLEEDIDVTGETRFIVTNDADVPGWNVIVPDAVYKLKIDFLHSKSRANIFKSHENLYIIGGATEAGWNVGMALPFVKDEHDPDVFTFEGELKTRPEYVESNLFKILGQLDWQPYSLHPYTPDEPALESAYLQISTGDNKWLVNEDKQGKYIIRVNTLCETFEAQFVEDGSAVNKIENDEYFKTTPVAGGLRVEMLDGYSVDSLQLIGMDGGLVYSVRNAGKEILLGQNVTSGIYILKISCDKKHFVQRVLIR